MFRAQLTGLTCSIHVVPCDTILGQLPIRCVHTGTGHSMLLLQCSHTRQSCGRELLSAADLVQVMSEAYRAGVLVAERGQGHDDEVVVLTGSCQTLHLILKGPP